MQEHCEEIHDLQVCPPCRKSFPGKRALVQHIGSVHKGQFFYECQHCEKKFINKTDLKKHLSRPILKCTKLLPLWFWFQKKQGVYLNLLFEVYLSLKKFRTLKNLTSVKWNSLKTSSNRSHSKIIDPLTKMNKNW